jgi:hypothetical protein
MIGSLASGKRPGTLKKFTFKIRKGYIGKYLVFRVSCFFTDIKLPYMIRIFCYIKITLLIPVEYFSLRRVNL